MAFAVASLLGFAFGAADQYLGSRIMLGDWAWSVSVMSAPWLALPFAAGCTQTSRLRASVLGLTITAAALAGYFAMTLSPIENVPLAKFTFFLPGLVHSQIHYIVGGALTGPVYGLLGQRWRVSRSPLSACLVAGALCLEPVARMITGQLSPAAVVWEVEAAAGAALAAVFVVAALRRPAAGGG